MSGPPGRPRTAAIVDVGSNSTRLFLCSGLGPDGPQGTRDTIITGLRRGAAADGTVAPDALARLDECLAGYAARIAAFAPDVVVPIATSAAREAPNRADIVAVVERRLGAPARVLSGEEEAALAFAGARLAVPDGAPATVVDVGGGSTEIVHGTGRRPDHATSLRVGSVRCTESHLPSDPPAGAEMDALTRHVRRAARPAVLAIPPGAVTVGVAGTVTTFAAILLGAYDPARVHGFRLSLGDLEETTRRLAALPLAERRTVPGLHPERAAVIVAGGIILATVAHLLGASEILVSERDILDGAALEALGGQRGID